MNYFYPALDFIKNAGIVRDTGEYLSLIPDYFRSRTVGGDNSEIFSGVATYCMFIGIGRSGTTLIGSLLDAHPNIIIAHQQNTLKYLRFGLFSRIRIYNLLLANSRQAAHTKRMGNGGYSYVVPNQWQGRAIDLQVIGDKSMSAQAVTWLHATPSLLRSLAKTTGAAVRLIHVIRNPYDTITTRAVRRKLSLEKISKEYFAILEKLQVLIQRIDEEESGTIQRIPVHLEDFIQDPVLELRNVCRQLGVRAEDEYLKSCAGIVYNKPHLSRRLLQWNPKLIESVKENIDQYPFLTRYSFKNT